MKEPKAVIEDGKVVNGDQLKKFYSDWYFRNERIRRGTFNDLRDTEPIAVEPQKEIISYQHYPHIHRYTKQEAGRLFLRMDNLEKSLKKVIIDGQTVYPKKKSSKYE